ncbi:MAG: hypothetical protein HOP12_14795 [Candidatus Eisenbacteria bacterium]|uniref:Peptidase A2 domain-containing protein n=1 Tax=Eiseniibacteriota bacterium TaxID=2212470 RepID=A0A849SVM1_UNCEI|nr:hypothetical protein [Candidatus Eisenbacteria bacterium]
MNSHLAVRLSIGDRPAAFLLDTGAPITLLDRVCADSAGLTTVASTRTVRGLDGTGLQVASTVIARAYFAGRRFEALPAEVAALPVFGSLNVLRVPAH